MKTYHGSIDIGLVKCFRLCEVCETLAQPKLSKAEIAERIAFYQRKHAGRCSCCGELIGDVDKCPVCKTQQRSVGQRNSAQRKTVGGFCAKVS